MIIQCRQLGSTCSSSSAWVRPALLRRHTHRPTAPTPWIRLRLFASHTTRPHAGTEAVAFERSQAEARDDFRAWFRKTTPSMVPPPVMAVESVFLPYWTFTCDLTIPSLGIHRVAADGPTLQVYSGGKYPRSLLSVCKNDIIYARPFSARLLELDGGGAIDVEPFELYEATAWQLARQQHLLHESSVNGGDDPKGAVSTRLSDATFTNVESHRVLMPAHIVTYVYLTVEFRVFVNGRTGEAYGIQQTALFGGISISQLLEQATKLQTVVEFLNRMRLPPQAIALIVQGLALVLRPALKVLLWPPFLVGSLLTVGAYAAAKTTESIRTQHTTFAQWQETRKTEQSAQSTMTDDWAFRPSGESAADRARARSREQAEQAAWEARAARSRAERAQRAGGSSASQQQPTGRTAASSPLGAKPSAGSAAPRGGKLPPRVDGDDFYAVLGLQSTAATEEEVKAAFRRELMKFHPDHQEAGEGGYDKAACSERTRLIIRAYGTLRDPAKRRVHDAGYRGSAARR